MTKYENVARSIARALFELGEWAGNAKVGRIEFKSETDIYADNPWKDEIGLGGLCEDALAVFLAKELSDRLRKHVDGPSDYAGDE